MGDALTQGWNNTNVETLKSNIRDTFDTLQQKTDILDGIYDAVKECWKGPDANKYLQDIYDKTVALLDEVKTAYDKIDGEIDDVAKAWDTYQQNNA